ncbi:MAG: S-layer homology domain-containing protein, partial [Anaerolineales bacterium]
PQVRQLIWDSASPSTTQGVAPYWIMQGAKGWRLDVGGDVDPGVINDPTNDYWEGFRAAVHAQDSSAYIVGEEWGNAISWTLGNEWDATMNYQFSAAVLSFWRDTTYTDNDFNAGSSAGALTPLTAEGVSERLRNLQERYPPEAFYAMMNLFGSHDTNRALFLLDHNTYQNDTALYANPNYDWSDAITRLKGAALMQMTLPGAPTIYYGDEIGLVGPVSFDGTQWQDDPYNRQPYPWLDETGTPFYAHLQSTSSRNALFTYYQTLIGTRSAHPALRTGSFDPLWEQTGSNIYAYGRKMADDSDAAIVVVNKGATTGSVTLQLGGYLPVGLTFTDVFTSATFTVAGDGSLAVTGIPARGGYLLVPAASFAGTRPGAPTISATTSGGTQVTVSWSSVPGAAGYVIYRSRLGGGGYEQVGTTASTSFTDTAVQPGTRYYYVARAIASNGLTSALSNEVTAQPAYTIDWANLQWPFTLTAARSLVTPTANIYGQVYIAGVTANPGPTPSLIAQVGYGNDGTLPTDSSWRWFDTTFNTQVGNNDEFVGQLIPSAAPGSYDYLYRYSTDGGNTWVYGGNGWFGSNLTSYNPANAGDLTITVPSDTTAPDAPTNLTVTGTTTDSISLAWDAHPNTDGDLYGFEVWRRDLTAGETSFTRVALLAGAALTAYTDSAVTANHQYEYYITAVDNSANASAASNTVTATAEMRIVAVTFRVNVPNPTPGTVYIAGSFPAPLPNWTPGGIALSEVSPGVWEVTLNILDGTTIQYKYTRGSWDTVEKGTLHEEIANRSVTTAYGISGTQLVTDTVVNWRDPIVIAIAPADGATGVSPATTIEASWNQPMADPMDPAACFAVSGPGGSVSGTVTYVPADMKYVFTPDANLTAGTYTVSISGCKDAQGDTQQVAFNSTFSVPDTTAPTVTAISRASASPTNAASVDFTVTFSESVTGVDASDFSLTTSGSITGAGVTDVSGSGASYTVSVNTGAGSGTLRLDLNASGTGIEDLAGNPIAGGYTDGEAYTIDKDAPSVVSIVRQNPTAQLVTSGASVTFRVTFSRDVTGVDDDDFALTLLSVPGANAVVSGVSQVTMSVYDVTVNLSTLRNASNRLDGAIRLDVPATATITDLYSNALTGLPYTGGEVYSVVQEQTFGDVAPTYWAWTFIERLYYNGVTTGCGAGNYCPGAPVTRAQMAVFLLRAIHGPGYVPPAVDSGTGFADVPVTHWAAAWIKQLAVEGITTGCGGGNYCPEDPVSRDQMAVFLLRAKHGASYVPPAVGGSTGFADVPVTHWAAAWIKQLAAEGITTGCGGGNYCPATPVTRDQMAVFLIRTFNLP